MLQSRNQKQLIFSLRPWERSVKGSRYRTFYNACFFPADTLSNVLCNYFHKYLEEYMLKYASNLMAYQIWCVFHKKRAVYVAYVLGLFRFRALEQLYSIALSRSQGLCFKRYYIIYVFFFFFISGKSKKYCFKYCSFVYLSPKQISIYSRRK